MLPLAQVTPPAAADPDAELDAEPDAELDPVPPEQAASSRLAAAVSVSAEMVDCDLVNLVPHVAMTTEMMSSVPAEARSHPVARRITRRHRFLKNM